MEGDERNREVGARKSRLAKRSRPPPAKVTGTGDQRRPTDDDLIRTYDGTVAAWCHRSAQLGGCAVEIDIDVDIHGYPWISI